MQPICDLSLLANFFSKNSGQYLYVWDSFSIHFDAVMDEELLEAIIP